MQEQTPPDWLAAISQSFMQLYQKVLSHAPQIIGAFAIFIAGLLLAYILQFLTNKIVSGFDNLFKRVTGPKQNTVQESYAYILSKIVFWCVLLFFLNASANVLGWRAFSSWMNSLINYLPNVLASLLIMLVGFLLSNFCKNIINRRLPAQKVTENLLLASLIQWGIMFIVILLAVQQLGIDVTILTQIVVVATGVILGGIVLAFSLGACTLTANAIGSQYAKKYCRIGEPIKMGQIEGELLEITQTTLVIQTSDGVAVVPAKQFQEEVSVILKHESD